MHSSITCAARLWAPFLVTLLLVACGGGGSSTSAPPPPPAQAGVPNVEGMTQTAATTSITNAGLAVGTVTMASSSTVPAGSVISESPPASTNVATGSAVNLTVSSGPALIAVPNVEEMTQAAATSALTAAGLALGTVSMASSSTVPSGNVINQSPPAGTEVASGSGVDLTISIGVAPAQVAVPNVLGLTQVAATTALTGVGLVLGTVTVTSSASVPLGNVISQSPAAATQVGAGSAVNLTVSSGTSSTPVAVPNVVGSTQASATSALNAAGLVVGAITMQSSATVASGLVISQTPTAGSSVTSGSAVSLVVSSGSAKIVVPNVIGQTQSAATTAITGAGLTVGAVTTQSSATVASGLVISENPTAGTSVTSGSAVNLIVSSGVARVSVPNVVGLTQTAATSAITGAGLALGTVTMAGSATVPSGNVIAESPAAGTGVATGSAINLSVSTGPANVSVPNVVGLTQAAATTSITAAGLNLGAVTSQSSATVAAGLVISESPAAGTTATLGSAVNLAVSSGGASIPTAIGASVPAAASGLITTFYCASTTVAVGGSVPTLPDGSVPVLFAGDGVNDPLLLAVGSTTGTLDASTTAIGLVRMALGVVVSQAPLTSDVLASAIQVSPHYAQLLTDVNASLTIGQSPLNSATVPQDAIQVAQDAIVTLNSNGVLASADAKIKVAAAPIQISPPLPYYFIKGSEPYNQLWLTDNPGTMTVNAMNQTFIAWQFDTADSSGNALSSKVFSEPLKSTTLQVFGYYGGSATITLLTGASPEFTLTLSQSDPVKLQNLLSAVNQFWIFLASAASGISAGTTELQCISTTVSTTFSAQVTQVVGQPSATTALALFKSILNPITIYKLASSCSGNVTSSLVSTIFGQTIGRAWTVLNVVNTGFSDLGTAAETFYYWDFPSQDYLVCKTNGGITSFPCVTLQIAPSAPSVPVGSTVALSVSATDGSGNPITQPPNLQWNSSDTTLASVSGGVVTGVAIPTSNVSQPTITVTDPASGATASVIVTVTTSNPWLGMWTGTTYIESNCQPPAGANATTLSITAVSGNPNEIYLLGFFGNSVDFGGIQMVSGNTATNSSPGNGTATFTLSGAGNGATIQLSWPTGCYTGTYTYAGP